MAKDKKNNGRGAAPVNNTGRPTGSYSSYATNGYGNSYGYGGGSGAYGRSPYGAYGTANAANNAKPANVATNNNNPPAQGNTKVEKVDLPDKANMTRKQKKLAKKSKKFDETDLRCYPMTVGSWIGTFILLAIPLIGGICAICWFFGVGNKSRTAWVRSYVVISLLIVLVLSALLGGGYAILAKNAKDVDLKETYGEQYGTLGDYGFMGTVYYVACKAVDLLEDQLGGPEATQEIKAMLAQKLLGIGAEDSGENGENGENGGTVEAGGGSVDDGGEFQEQAA